MQQYDELRAIAGQPIGQTYLGQIGGVESDFRHPDPLSLL